MSKRKTLDKTLSLKDIRKGMWLTLKHFFSKPFTVQYPEEERVIAARFRGLHELEVGPGLDKVKCVGCGLCEAYCPTACITVFTGNSAAGERDVYDYVIDASRCIYCGLCEEACPVEAIQMGRDTKIIYGCRDEFCRDKECLIRD